ncbi:MAG TPA: hypothetical protein VFS20_23630 [Longimicrobium sp.]|nr:hypothetical protein [Longimicrobium sp.]
MPDNPANDATNAVNDPKSIEKVGIALFVLIVALLAWLYLLSGAVNDKSGLIFFDNEWIGIGRVTYEQVLILAVIAAGALGGCVHVASSFSDYVGNARYKASWEWWYLLRPFVGSALAMVFYFLIRANLFSFNAQATPEPPSFFAAAGLGFLVGMFSKQASDKLDDLFDTLFKTDKDAQRRDGLEEKVPEPSKVTPDRVAAGTASLDVVIAGSNLKGAKLQVNGADHTVTSVDDAEIKFTFTTDELATPTTHKLNVSNAAGAATTTLEFVVTAPFTPDAEPPADGGAGAGGEPLSVPELTGVTPTKVLVGTAGQEVVIAGSNLKGAQLKVNDTDHATTSTEHSEIKFTFTPEELATPTVYKLGVANAAGTAATTLEFTVFTEQRTSETGSADDRGTGDGGEPLPDPAEAIIDTSTLEIQPSTPSTATGIDATQDPPAAPPPATGETNLASEGSSPSTAVLDSPGIIPTAETAPVTSLSGETTPETAPAGETTSGTTPTGEIVSESGDSNAKPEDGEGEGPEETLRV